MSEEPTRGKGNSPARAGEVAREFFRRVLAQAGKLQLPSDDHFTAHGTLIEAWAS